MEAHSPYQLLADVSKISEPTAAGIFRMASKSWSLMYTIARVENALEHALSHLSGSASATYPAAFKAGIEALKSKDLTTVVAMSGTAMLPTLNGYAPQCYFPCFLTGLRNDSKALGGASTR